MANGAVLTITREEVEPMLAIAKSDGGNDRTRGLGFTIMHLERMRDWFAVESAAVSADFTRESLYEAYNSTHVGWDLFTQLVTFKGEVIAQRLEREAEDRMQAAVDAGERRYAAAVLGDDYAERY